MYRNFIDRINELIEKYETGMQNVKEQIKELTKLLINRAIYVDSNITLEPNAVYIVNTEEPRELILQLNSVTDGSKITIVDGSGQASINHLVVYNNGTPITIDVNFKKIDFYYLNGIWYIGL